MSADPTTEIVWRKPGAVDEAAVRSFWTRNQLLGSEAQIAKRLSELAMIARDGDRVIGVSTVEIRAFIMEGVKFGFFRCAVDADHRTGGLAIKFTVETQNLLDKWAEENPGEGVKGMAIVIENDKINAGASRGKLPVWKLTGQTLIGLDPNGNQVRIKWFDHATL